MKNQKPKRGGFKAGDKKKSFKKESSTPFFEKFKKKEKKSGAEELPQRPVRQHSHKTKLDYYEDKFGSDKKVTEGIRLNRYLAQAGICSRRDADELIAEGKVKVNNKVVKELGVKVMKGDKVYYEGRRITNETKRYVLLNKPNGFITTMEDTHGRDTVMKLIDKACEERIYPVGRLDRATTGLLLFTNDGDLAEKMTHPSNKIKKIYLVEIDKSLSLEDEDSIRNVDFELEDGKVQLDGFSVINGERTQLGIELHSGKNRIVRRVFEHFGYRVQKLDRTVYADLTKKDLPRGRFRHLTEKEVINLKFFIGGKKANARAKEKKE